MASVCSLPKKITVAAIAAIAVVTFVSAWCAGAYWSESRHAPLPSLGRVVERSDHGHRYYLTVTEDRFVPEYVFGGAVAALALAHFLNQRWSAFKS
jgi:hypothetical protein